jgi:hypothetical protein
MSAFRIRASDTRHAFGIITAFVKLADEPVDAFESVITVGLAVLLLVLRDEILIVPIDDFVEDGTAPRMVRLIRYRRFAWLCRAHTREYNREVTSASAAAESVKIVFAMLYTNFVKPRLL